MVLGFRLAACVASYYRWKCSVWVGTPLRIKRIGGFGSPSTASRRKGSRMWWAGSLGSTTGRVERKGADALQIARAYDAGRQASEAVMKVVDTYFEEKVVPVARNMIEAFEQQI